MNDKLEQIPNSLESPFLGAELFAGERSVETSASSSSAAINEGSFYQSSAIEGDVRSVQPEMKETQETIELGALNGLLDVESEEVTETDRRELFGYAEESADASYSLNDTVRSDEEVEESFVSEVQFEEEDLSDIPTDEVTELDETEDEGTAELASHGVEPQELQTVAADERLVEAGLGEGSKFETDHPNVLKEVDIEHGLDEPSTEQEGFPPRPRSIQVVAARNVPVTVGEYAFHQGKVTESGKLDANGRAYFRKIDPSQPFLFEVRDRVCAIRTGAFFDPDDAKIQYGGTQFDWTLVRDNKKADKNFWPYYQQEMDTARKNINPHTVEKFLQHEHITRRPIRIAKPYLTQLSKVTIQATPARVRVGPFVRYTDHARAVIWLETVTSCMVRVRFKKAGGSTESSRYASTVRVGGRHFAAVEIDGLEENHFYDYTLELVPLPATGSIPVDQGDFKDVFPKLNAKVAESMKSQLSVSSLNKTEWLTFRTLRRKYDKKLRFATGSCRWYPGDTKGEKDKKALGPDMFDGLGKWLQANPKEKWPHFLFFGGDQIYSDEIGDNHGLMLTFGRFAERIPGPADPAGSVRDKLIDGAWAGRFAHRYKPYKYPGEKFIKTVQNGLQKLDDIHARYPDIKGIYREYPEAEPREKLKERHRTLKNRRELNRSHSEDPDERKAREAVALLPVVDNLEISTEPFRAFLPHWNAGFGLAYRQGQDDPGANPMGLRYLSHNFLLWSIPDFERLLPTIADRDGFTVVRKPDDHGHPSAEGGQHAADFTEYAYLHERSWTSSRDVRVLLAQVPTFLMFDDHELTDDWNFDASWVRMLHNEKDAYGMWPKTLTDGLAAYWVYQAWCNKAPSQWKGGDPRVKALTDAQKAGIDALPELRKCIHKACFMPWPPIHPNAPYQFGMALDWHYKLPFDPPFLVPDCRSRKFMVQAEESLRIIDHDDPKKKPMSQTIDHEQLAWMRKILVEHWQGGPVAFIAPSTPLLMQKKVMAMMRIPEMAARAWAQGVDLTGLGAALFDSPKLGTGSDELLRVFRRARDLEHMIRDKSWRDLWALVEAMRKKGSHVKTMVLVSGDVHHSYCMTANPPGSGRPQPELVQITSSGLQTPIRKDLKSWVGEEFGTFAFDVGKYRLVPGFVRKNDIGALDLVLYENTVAIVDVAITAEVDVVVTFLAGQNRHLFRYTSGASYMTRSLPTVLANHLDSRERLSFEPKQETGVQTMVGPRPPDRQNDLFDSDHESPFLGELFFNREADDMGPRTGPLLRESPFGARLPLQPWERGPSDESGEEEGPSPAGVESRFLDEEQLGADATPLSAEQEKEFMDLEAGGDPDVEFQALVPANAPAQTGTPIMWRDPGDVASKNLKFGIGSKEGQPKPPFQFEKEDNSGSNPKIKVIDANGVRWNIKFDEEVHAEVACSRIVWACGYMVEESYFVQSGKVHGVKNLDRAKKFLRDGSFTNGMFEKRPNNIARRGKHWKWDNNLFNGKRELYGLAMLAFLLNNWDAKPDNNNVLGMHDHDGSVKEWYVVADWGGTLGKTGRIFNSKWDVDDYAQQAFLESTSATAVRFHYSGKPYTGSLGGSLRSVPREHVRWFAGIIGQLTDYQIGDAFRAAGATQEEVKGFTKVIRNRIYELKNPVFVLDKPYRWICRLEVSDNDLRRVVGYGTGLLISDRHVLTAARVIHDFSRDRRRYSVRITPGYEFGKEAFGSTTASQARVSPKFSPDIKDGSADYGLLILSRPLGSVVFSSIGNTALGSWRDESHGLSTGIAEWSGKAVHMHVATFSRSFGGGGGYHKLRVSTGAMRGLQRGQILHDASSKLDAPGAPIWVEVGKRRLLVGIVSSVFSKDSELNFGCYLSQETQNQLMQWINMDREHAELEVHEDFNQDDLEFVLASPEAESQDWNGETSPKPVPQGEDVESA